MKNVPNFQWKMQENPILSPDFCRVLLGCAPAILPEKCSNFDMTNTENSNVFFRFLRHFARLPPSNFSLITLQCSRKTQTNSIVFSWFLQRFARLPPSNFAWKILQVSMRNRDNPDVFSWSRQGFAKLPPSNFLHEKCSELSRKNAGNSMRPLISAGFCYATP